MPYERIAINHPTRKDRKKQAEHAYYAAMPNAEHVAAETARNARPIRSSGDLNGGARGNWRLNPISDLQKRNPP